MRQFLIIFLVSPLWYISTAFGQCDFGGTIDLPDQTTQYLEIEVTGAENDELADPAQGVCGIEIEFAHTQVGDLVMSLTSPAGDMVTLIGPTGPFGVTDFTTWDITFLPCGFPADPDPGFNDVWNNNQAWGAFSNYTGSYYPFQDCLENFDSGPVNGTWTLFIQDNVQFDAGQITHFRIIFCDGSGIDCSTCVPDGGTMNILDVTGCQGAEDLFPEIEVEFELEQPDTAIYGYYFVISQGGDVTDFFAEPDFRDLPVGSYTVCGLSILLSDTTAFDTLIGNITIGELQMAVEDDSLDICAEFSSDCFPLRVRAVPEPGMASFEICHGDTLHFLGETFDSSGTYELVTTAANGCDSMVILELDVIRTVSRIDSGGVFGCGIEQLVLRGDRSEHADEVSYEWYTPDGRILGPIDADTILIDTPGTYFLVTSLGGCPDTTSIGIVEDLRFPAISLHTDTITCRRDSILLRASSDLGGTSFLWQYPDMTERTGDTVVTDQAGTYTLVGTAFNQCETDTTFTVHVDTILPEITTEEYVVPCPNSPVELIPSQGAENPDWTYQWVTPAGDTLDQFSPTVTSTGMYGLIVTAGNGCISTGVSTVTASLVEPPAQIRYDTIDCANPAVWIEAEVEADTAFFTWTGPAGQLSDTFSIQAGMPGRYDLVVIFPEGCLTDTFVEIPIDTMPPDIDIAIDDSLNCENQSGTASVLQPVFATTYTWTSPSGAMQMGSEAILDRPGWWGIGASAANGCTAADSFFLPIDTIPPRVNLSGDSLDCFTPTGRILVADMPSGNRYEWSGPAGFESFEKEPAVDTGGWYVLLTTGRNECNSTDSIFIFSDLQRPGFELDLPSFACGDTAVVLAVEPGEDGYAIEWRLPDLSTAAGLELIATEPGTYRVTAQDTANGCSTMRTFTLAPPAAGIEAQITAGDISCREDSAYIGLSLSRPVETILWEGPASFASMEEDIAVAVPGRYELAIIDSAGCRLDTFADIGIDTTSPEAVLIQEDSLICDQREVGLDGSGSTTGAEIEYRWSTVGGQFAEPPAGPEAVATAPGSYLLEVHDDTNGCSDSALVTVVELPSLFDSLRLRLQHPACAGQLPGSAAIDTVFGGYPPLSYSLDGMSYTPSPVFTGLDAGDHTVSVRDRYGCLLEVAFTLVDTGTFTVVLPADMVIMPGQSVIIPLETDLAAERTASIRWYTDQGEEICPGCREIEVAPLEPTYYTVEVTDTGGCALSDQIFVDISAESRVYIPTAFSPNEDGINDIFVPYATPGVRIELLQIFGRWGNVVHESGSFAAGDLSFGWDGTYDGHPLDPGLFIYRVEFRYLDGSIETRSGEVYLVR